MLRKRKLYSRQRQIYHWHLKNVNQAKSYNKLFKSDIIRGILVDAKYQQRENRWKKGG